MENTIKYISYTYKLKEMLDEMINTKSNIEKVVEQQTKLIVYLEQANDNDYIAVINQLKQNNEKYNSQVKLLQHRIECLRIVEQKLTTEKLDYVFSLLLEALGLENREGKTVQERIDNHEDYKELN